MNGVNYNDGQDERDEQDEGYRQAKVTMMIGEARACTSTNRLAGLLRYPSLP
jgi:hypothetical protein